MSGAALDFCLRLQHAQAHLQLVLDEALGTQHGLSLADFMLMQALAPSPQTGLPLRALVRPLGVPASAVLRRLLPLEKVGLLQRLAAPGAATCAVVLRPAGVRLLREAQDTAEQVCGDALKRVPEALRPAAGAALAALAAPACTALEGAR